MHYHTLPHTTMLYDTLPYTTTHYHTLGHTNMHYHTLAHTATHYHTLPNTLPCTSTHYHTLPLPLSNIVTSSSLSLSLCSCFVADGMTAFTILISAVFHEYVLWAPVRFVLSLLLFMFGIFGGMLSLLFCSDHTWLQLSFHRCPLLCEAKLQYTFLELLSSCWAQPRGWYDGVCVCHRVLCPQDLLSGGEAA